MLPPPVLVEPEHRSLLRESAAGFVAKAGLPANVRPRRKTEAGFDAGIWREMAELGWTQLAIPEEKGGLGMDFADLAALLEEIGKGALPEPMVAVSVLAAGALAAGENEALCREALPGLLSGETLATLAWQSRTGAMSAADVEIEARSAGTGFLLSGEAIFVPIANSAEAFIVAARCGGGVAMFWVPRAAAGLAVETLRVADYTAVGNVRFDDVELDAGALVAGPATGAALLDRLLDQGRIAVCAEAVGVMHQTLSVTIDYLNTREQFGQPIGAFQALQHRAVNLYVLLELSRSAVMKAAAAIDEGRPDVSVLAAACKARCAEAGTAIAGQSVHLHGTIGFTEELDLSILIRRAHLLSAWLGNGDASLRRYTRLRWPEGVTE